ncbi:hypothetical protein, partial [Actinomadura alba]|uniref:hypothetical protein n=1 Tax=Actinomadura alba TaxID=406431 RepID=UPI001C9CCE78
MATKRRRGRKANAAKRRGVHESSAHFSKHHPHKVGVVPKAKKGRPSRKANVGYVLVPDPMTGSGVRQEYLA